MTVDFVLRTTIAAPPARVFSASLDIDAHLAAMEASGEQAVGGVTSGLIGLGETVTWQAKHFGVTWKMTSKITELEEPVRFVDEQVRGPFRRFRHEHCFEEVDGGTLMIDRITFDAPLGPMGDLVEKLVLGAYLPKLIEERNGYLRDELERT
jgi:ligand-binding SRPBCC domain-containing protein